MDIQQRKNILTHLAKIADKDSSAATAIIKEVEKIELSLANEINYENIEQKLDLLDVISYRQHEKSVKIITGVLRIIRSSDIIYENSVGFSDVFIKSHKGKEKLVIAALKSLENIRYHEPDIFLETMFEYSVSENEDVKKQAIHGLETFAEYDLDIFYGDGKDWGGLGWGPQEKIISLIYDFDASKLDKYFHGIIATCGKVLSPTIEGRQWNYNSVNLRTGVVPIGVKDVRRKAIINLFNMYGCVNSFEKKNSVIETLNRATQTPHMASYSDDILAMVVSDTVDVLQFMLKVVSAQEDLQVMQKIENDAYWFFYHKRQLNPEISYLALKIRDELYKNEEYSIYRVLIGFESIFHEWDSDRNDFDYENKFRESECRRLANNINDNTYEEWKNRIIKYANVKSNDMATFPSFGYFLEFFGESNPTLALKLLSEISHEIERFIVAVLHGIYKTQQYATVDTLVNHWCEQGEHLFSLARFFEFPSEHFNIDLFRSVFLKAKEKLDLKTLSQIIGSVSARYNENYRNLISDFFLPALQILTSYGNTDWIYGFWFRKQGADIISIMEKSEHEVILNNFLFLKEIDYQSEEVLYKIATYSPELVLVFFCDRITLEQKEDRAFRYEAVPYNFHKISTPLSTIPDIAVDIMFDRFDGNYGIFIYREAKLLKNIFPSLPKPFEEKLISVIRSSRDNRFLFVMAILRNYDGEPVIHGVCIEIIREISEDVDLLNEIKIILQSTGVVSGEYGYVEAYTKKIEEVSAWLIHDKSEEIDSFVKNYISEMQKRIAFEKQRADENLLLLKHKYGNDN